MPGIWTWIKNKAAGSTLGIRGLLTTSDPIATYVYDSREVLTYYRDGRRCKYPENYNKIVKSGKIIPQRDKDGEPQKDKKGNILLKLLYGPADENGEQPSFNLALVKEARNRSYFTIDFPVSISNLDESYIEPFKFSRIDLEKHVPVFEVDTELCQLTNSSVLDEKGRNGKLLFTSYYGKPSTDPPKDKTEAKFNAKTKTHFSEITDQNNNIEWDKSLISVPIVLASSLAKIAASVLTYLPMKLGEFLIGKKHPIAKAFGYPLFTAGAIVKHSVNMLSTMPKAIILLFVANEKKYGDKYNTKLEHQLIGHWDELKSDFYFIINGKREPEQEETRPNLEFTATWDELDKIKPGIKKDLEKTKNSGGKVAGETLQLKPPEKGAAETLRLQSSIGDRKTQILEDAGEEIKLLRDAVSREETNSTETPTKHANGVQSRRNSQTVVN